MKEMKNTALIKPNVLLLAWSHSGLRLCWGWMHLATPAASGWDSMATASLVPAGAPGTGAAAGQLAPNPTGITAGGPRAKSRTGGDADAAGECPGLRIQVSF